MRIFGAVLMAGLMLGCTAGTKLTVIEPMEADPHDYDGLIVNAMHNDTVSTVDFETCREIMREVADCLIRAKAFTYVHVSEHVTFDAPGQGDAYVDRGVVPLDTLLLYAQGIAACHANLTGCDGDRIVADVAVSDHGSGAVLARGVVDAKIKVKSSPLSGLGFPLGGGFALGMTIASQKRDAIGPLADGIAKFVGEEFLQGIKHPQVSRDVRPRGIYDDGHP